MTLHAVIIINQFFPLQHSFNKRKPVYHRKFLVDIWMDF